MDDRWSILNQKKKKKHVYGNTDKSGKIIIINTFMCKAVVQIHAVPSWLNMLRENEEA